MAAANSRLFALLAHLVLDGLSAQNRFLVDSIPSLGPFVPLETHPDEMAAEHQRFFGYELLPWASVFLSDDAQLGGPIASTVSQTYERAGFRPADGHEPDHLGNELMFIAWLWDRRQGDAAAEFAGQHVTPWLTPLACAGIDVGGFYAQLLPFTLELCLAFAVPPPDLNGKVPAVLDDPRSGLKQVAHWLATPAWSGLFWTHRTLGQVGKRTGVPHGFGSREKSLESLLFASSDAGRLPELTAEMQSVIQRWKSCMEGPAAPSWIARLDGASQVLGRLGKA